MKKMMIIFAVLFTMVGSSFGGQITGSGWYNKQMNPQAGGWGIENCVKVVAFYHAKGDGTPEGKARITFKASSGEFFHYDSESNDIDNTGKGILAQLLYARNNDCWVNPHVTGVEIANSQYTFSALLVH